VVGVDAVVAQARRDQDRRVIPAGICVVVGGNLAEELPIVGAVGVPVFGDPAGAGHAVSNSGACRSAGSCRTMRQSAPGSGSA
jgi:hypothetical protein